MPCLLRNRQQARASLPEISSSSLHSAAGCLGCLTISNASGGHCRHLRGWGAGSIGKEGIPHLCLHVHTDRRKGRRARVLFSGVLFQSGSTGENWNKDLQLGKLALYLNKAFWSCLCFTCHEIFIVRLLTVLLQTDLFSESRCRRTTRHCCPFYECPMPLFFRKWL